MQNNVVITLYLLTLLIAAYISKRKAILKNDDFFNVYNVFILVSLLEIPYLFYIANNQDSLHLYVSMHIDDFNEVFSKHIFLEFLFFLFAFLALFIFKPKARLLTKLLTINTGGREYNFLIHIIFLFVSLIIFYFFSKSIGGIEYLLYNLSIKTEVVSGTGYYRNAYLVLSFLSVGFLIVFIGQNNKIKKGHIAYLFAIVLLFFIMLSLTGARKNPILLILYTMVMWEYKVRKIRVISLRNITIFSFILIYVAIVPLFRTLGSTEFYLDDPTQLFIDSLDNLGLLFGRFSDIDRSLFIYSHFNISNLWLGSSFGDILTAPIPRVLFPDKPPTDEGVYIYALAHGMQVTPPTSYDLMYPTGWPTSRVTGMFINFWYPGVIVGGIITGYIYKYIYMATVNTNYNPLCVYIYISMMLTSFGLTNLMIVNNLIIIVFLIIIAVMISSIKLLKK